jgi:hypothetical protein
MSNDAAELLYFTFELHVALNSILGNPHYFSGGRSSFAFVVGLGTFLNA